MEIPIIMSAFGTTSKAIATYSQLDTIIRNRFPQNEIIWAYSSKRVIKKLHDQQKSTVLTLEDTLHQLDRKGVEEAIVQSLHLFPGTEFHSLLQVTKKSQISCAIGMPLLTTPEDYQQIGEILRQVISKRPDKAILVLGHGTDHPTWTAYYSLEKILRKKFGERMYVGVVEKYPDTSHVIDEIAHSGFPKVCIIPLFLVAGMHYRRDIISNDPASWQSRLQSKEIEVEAIDHGLGLYEGFDQLLIRHIQEAAEIVI